MTKDCWVSPKGIITWCENTAEHEKLSYEIMKANNWYYEEYMYYDNENHKWKYQGSGSDFLINVKGFIKYMDWGYKPDWFRYDINKITDAQARVMLHFEKLYQQRKQELKNQQ
ncbi:MAG: hypothetical protein LBP63_10000 [Prevotellaceae bacterium]|jgi:hypothetical protein|nr:hypothetical protein [Prevotellaceae bacterium]